jgi:large subunit ribosomal protein L41
MFHPSPILGRALRRLALTTKQAGKDYYKGTGTGSMGEHTKHGKYIINPAKVRTYVFPEFEKMEACQV